jgi:hypothetical protein
MGRHIVAKYSIALAGLTMRLAFVAVGCASLHLRLIKCRLCEALGVLLRIVIKIFMQYGMRKTQQNNENQSRFSEMILMEYVKGTAFF